MCFKCMLGSCIVHVSRIVWMYMEEHGAAHLFQALDANAPIVWDDEKVLVDHIAMAAQQLL